MSEKSKADHATSDASGSLGPPSQPANSSEPIEFGAVDDLRSHARAGSKAPVAIFGTEGDITSMQVALEPFTFMAQPTNTLQQLRSSARKFAAKRMPGALYTSLEWLVVKADGPTIVAEASLSSMLVQTLESLPDDAILCFACPIASDGV